MKDEKTKPECEETTEVAEAEVTETKPKKKHKGIIIAVVILVVIAVAAFLFLKLSGSKSGADSTATYSSTTQAEVVEDDYETEVVAETVTNENGEAVTNEDGEAETVTKVEEVTEIITEVVTKDDGKTEVVSKAEKKSAMPKTKAEILAAYTTVMNQAKKDKPGFKKVEWQTLPSDANSRVVAEGESVVNTALNLAQNNFMTTEADSTSNPEIKEKGNDMSTFPICNSNYGCILTDEKAIKSATCVKLADGNYKITIVLNDEANPEPVKNATDKTAPSNHGGIFSPVSKKEIDDTLHGGIVSAVAKDIEYSLVYHDCKTEVVYNPNTNQIVSLDQYTNVTISGSGKIALIKLDVTKQELVDEMHISDLKY